MSKPIEILMVDDNPGDIDLAREALEEGKVSNTLHIAHDGIEALAFLRRQGKYAAVPRPDLILLDLNMPRMSGQETLAEIKKDSTLMRIPVVILTTSQAERDVTASYNLHANCYIIKPVDFGQFMSVVKAIDNFWLSVVKLPSE